MCPFCCACYTRYKVIDEDLGQYTCFQGYCDNACCRAGMCCENNCPAFCLCLETVLCLGPSVSVSRLYAMDRWDLRPDPCDNQTIRFSNCLQVTACVCDIIAIFVPELRDCAQAMRLLADCAFYTTIGCMMSQVQSEVRYRRSNQQPLSSSPAEIPSSTAYKL